MFKKHVSIELESETAKLKYVI